MKSKLCTFSQDGRPLSAKLSAKLDADHRVESYHTEWHPEGRMIFVDLAAGYNYEQRSGIVGCTAAEILESLTRVEQGAPDPRNA
jgi:hypothetical protein